VALAAAIGCEGGDVAAKGKGPGRAAAPPSAVPQAAKGMELQEEDYARARADFRTKLRREGPSPQGGTKPEAPKRVTEVEYTSGGLRLGAWVSHPDPDSRRKMPGVVYLYAGFGFGTEDWEEAKPFREAGYVVLTPRLRGQNGQAGHFTRFYDEVDDVLAAADRLGELPGVDPELLFVAGHGEGGTLALLAAMASNHFRAAASFSAAPDQSPLLQREDAGEFPFDPTDLRELRVRSPVAYATSFKCPARLYIGSREAPNQVAATWRTAMLARQKGLDVEAVVLPSDGSAIFPEAVRQAVEFFDRQ
jgi:dipeptidyl aminopeptidase/acylaminoacyl peptidase